MENLKDIKNKLKPYGYKAPYLIGDKLKALSYTNSKGKTCTIDIPRECVRFYFGRLPDRQAVEVSFEDIRKDSWEPPKNP